MSDSRNITHVCFLDDSPTQIITPIIDQNVPGTNLTIITSMKNASEVNAIIHLARSRGFKVSIWDSKSSDTYLEIKENLLELFNDISSQGGEIWLNVSCGKKHEAIIAYEIAVSFGARVYLVDAGSDNLYWLSPNEAEPIPLQDKLKLHEYFSMHGFLLSSQQNKSGINKGKRELGYRWAENALRLSSGLGKLNYLAQKSNGSNYISPQLNESMVDDPMLRLLLEDLEKSDL